MKIDFASWIRHLQLLDLPNQPTLSWKSRIAVLLLSTIIIFFRAPYEFINPQLWAEDGSVFLSEARTLGISSIITPYAGYLNVLPRFFALVAQLFPLEYTPRIFFIASLSVTLFVCFVLSATPWLPSKLKIAFPLAVVFSPHNGEVFLTLTNIHWVCALLIPFIAFGTANHSTRHMLGSALLLIFIGLSDPFIIIFYPLFVIRFFMGNQAERRLCLVATVCASLQAIVFIAGQHESAKTLDPNIWHWGEALLLRPLAGLFLGKEVGATGYSTPSAFYILSVGLGSFLCATGYAVITTGSQDRRVLFLLCFSAGIALLGTFLKFYSQPLIVAPFVAGDRYYFVPSAFISFALLWFTYTGTGWRKKLGVCACLLILLSTASVFQFPRKTDLHWLDYVKEFQNKSHIRVPLNPEGWHVDLYRTPPFSN